MDYGDTSTPIRYPSPPPRSHDDITTYLVSSRNFKHFESRHAVPDASAAQDIALGNADVLKPSLEAALGARKDSGVSAEGDQDPDDRVIKSESDALDSKLE